MEEWATEKVRRFLRARVGKGVRVVLRSADESVEDMDFALEDGGEQKEEVVQLLLVTYLTSLFSTDLVLSPSIPLALAVGSHTEHRWSTNNNSLFLEVFDTPTTVLYLSAFARVALFLGCRMMALGLTFAPLQPGHHTPS